MTTSSIGCLPEAWITTVADLLPWPSRAAAPFTLCEAAEELAVWARTARDEAWRKRNLQSLIADVHALSNLLGPRVRARVEPHVRQLAATLDRDGLPAAADALVEIWREPDTVLAAFDDLCQQARRAASTSGQLRPLAAVLASQLREGIAGGWSVLREAATALTGDPSRPQIIASFGSDATLGTLTVQDRLSSAKTILTKTLPVGRVVVWLVYDRALIPWRADAGTITFYRGEWMIPNAHADDGQQFEGRDEMRDVLNHAWWGEDLLAEVSKIDSRIVLVRVALGRRQPIGAVAEARRHVEALLSIAVEAGGVSWKATGFSAILLDGAVIGSSLGGGLGRKQAPDPGDSYGIGVTSEALQHAAEELDAALCRDPMPDFLVEALLALREAAMTDHRDVLFYGQRAVTPRVATALEDHALEAIASYAHLSTDDLADALEARHADEEFDQYLLRAFMAPLDDVWRNPDRNDRRDLEQLVSRFEHGRRIVSIPEVVRQRARFDALRMSFAARADFAEALQAVTDPEAEIQLRARVSADVALMRERYRRIRNAVTHGNPATDAALASIRTFAADTAHDAFEVALGAYANGIDVRTILQRGAARRAGEAASAAAGQSYVERHEP